jgi:hypothetical protein
MLYNVECIYQNTYQTEHVGRCSILNECPVALFRGSVVSVRLRSSRTCNLTCQSCRRNCIGQPERPRRTKCNECVTHTQSNNLQSAYVLHIFHNGQSYVAIDITVELTAHSRRGWRINTL